MSTESATSHVALDVQGMTCASCAMRIEKKLNRLPGVRASVNYATETADVHFDADAVSTADLIKTINDTGYGASIPAPAADTNPSSDGLGDPLQSIRTRLMICAVLTTPVVLLAMLPFLQFTYWQWLSFALASPVVVWGGLPFHAAAWKNARHGAATMDTLVSVGVIAAYGWSVWALFFGGAGEPGMTMPFTWVPSHHGTADLYLEVAAGVVTLILLGRYLEARAKRESGAALRALLELGAKHVSVIRDGIEIRVPIDQLAVGQEFIVRPGETIATDGEVVHGTSAVDASMLTGESMPIEVAPGSLVTGGTVNAGGRLRVRAMRVGADTALARMAQMVVAAQSGKAPVQRLADRVAAVFVPIVIGLAVVTFAGWLLAGGGLEFAFSAAIAVLIIACPCALGLATPTALLVGTGRGAQLGIVIKGPQMLESTREVDTVVLDKTGTITTGAMTVVDVVSDPSVTSDRVVQLAAALEHASEHPIARAVVDEAARRGVLIDEVTEFIATPGFGVSGSVDGLHVLVGQPARVIDTGAVIGADLASAVLEAELAGRTCIAIAWGGEVHGILVVADTPKVSSAAAIAELRALGLEPILLTGDHPRAAAFIANQVGIAPESVIAGVLPEGKLSAVEELQRQGKVVAMVGDGVNDAAALAQSDLGIAMGTGADAAIEAADLTIVTGDLASVPDAIRLSRRTLAIIKGNLFWAFAYNVAAIPLAALGLLNPLIAGAAMAFSSVFVVTNSLRLKRFQSWIST